MRSIVEVAEGWRDEHQSTKADIEEHCGWGSITLQNAVQNQLIREHKYPQRDDVAVPVLDIVLHYKAAPNASQLSLPLAFPAHRSGVLPQNAAGQL